MNIHYSPSAEAYYEGYLEGVEEGIKITIKSLPDRIMREFLYTHLLQKTFNYTPEIILEKINKLNEELNETYTG